MKIIKTTISDVLIINPNVFGDERGFFFESYNKNKFEDATGISTEFVQDNHSRSGKNILRGLHYQIKQPQGKLVSVASGEVFDVVVDLRRASPTFCQWVGISLSEENKKQLWVPPGFAHGFFVLSDQADVIYKTTDYYSPENERCIRWDDATLAIDWPCKEQPILSEKDAKGVALAEADIFE